MDLTTTYLGIGLKNPLVPSASPLSKKLDTIRALEDAGASAIVMYSLFEEQIALEAEALDHFLTRGTESFGEALSYFPRQEEYNLGPEEYLEHIRAAKEATDIPIIGSLNGVSMGGWIDYARKIQQAGADALELNIYFIPTDPAQDPRDLEDLYVDIVKAVTESVSIPVAVKLSRFFTSIPAMARRIAEAGARGLVLFNRFYQPDLDIEALEVKPGVVLSTSANLRVPLRWIAILYDRIAVDFAGTTGVHTAQDAIKLIMAGANVAQLCTVLLQRGPGHLRSILADLAKWMEAHEYSSVKMMRGSMSQKAVAEPSAFERANYMKAITTYDKYVR